MIKLLHISAAMLGLFAFTASNSVADDAAAPAAPSAVHSHESAGTKGPHPKHGNLHRHSTVVACMKHCDEHHKAHQGSNDDVHECKKLCKDHHKTKQTTNPSGFKGANTPK